MRYHIFPSGIGVGRAYGEEEKSVHHKAVNKPEAISTVSVDYGFFGALGETPLQSVSGKDLPVLVFKDRDPPTGTGALFAHPVTHKGLKDKEDNVDEYPVKVLVKDLNALGYKRVNMKSDQEHALSAVVDATKLMWKR